MYVIKPALQKRIVNLYPDKIVNNLKVLDAELQSELTSIAKDEGLSLKNLLESNGFSYIRRSIIKMYVEDYLDLRRIFEDDVVKSLYERDNKLYYKLLNHSKIKKVSLKQYLGMLGFEYELKKENLTLSNIKDELTELYKDKVVRGLSTINPSLYYKTYQYARNEGESINDFIESLGFEIERSKSVEKTVKKDDSKKTSNKNNKKQSTSKKREIAKKNIEKR